VFIAFIFTAGGVGEVVAAGLLAAAGVAAAAVCFTLLQ